MTKEQQERQAVVEEAMSWIKTPHHNGARLKGVGVDCGQFPLAVYEAAGMMPHVETGRYSPQFHLNRDEEWYLKLAMAHGKELPDGVLPQQGDFVLYKVGRVFSHGAIVIDWPTVIHSQSQIGVMVDRGDQGWMSCARGGKSREMKFFTLWG